MKRYLRHLMVFVLFIALLVVLMSGVAHPH